MIRLTNLADYAVVLMCNLAHAPDKIHSAVALSQVSGIPVPTVSKILGSLSRAELLHSQRGLGGGFSLGHSADDISVADIIEAVDGPIALTNCIENSPGDCDLEPLCSMKTHWQKINFAVKGALTEISLSEISAPHLPADSLSHGLVDSQNESGVV